MNIDDFPLGTLEAWKISWRFMPVVFYQAHDYEGCQIKVRRVGNPSATFPCLLRDIYNSRRFRITHVCIANMRDSAVTLHNVCVMDSIMPIIGAKCFRYNKTISLTIS